MHELSILTVFIAGFLSFFSPCILPLLPLYLSYLTNNSKSIDLNGKPHYNNLRIIIHSLAFIIGVLSVYFILALGIEYLESLINQYKNTILIIGGLVMILVALHCLGIIVLKPFNKHHQLKIKMEKISFIKAYLLGFCFGCTWSPCVSPILTAIITYSISNGNSQSFIYIMTYSLGFILPFIILSIFSKSILQRIINKPNIYKIVNHITSSIILIVGIFILIQGIKETNINHSIKTNNVLVERKKNQEVKKISAIPFSLKDENDQTITLDTYKNQFVMLNFVTSWCQYCQHETQILKEYQDKYQDIKIVLVMSEEFNRDGTDLKEYARKKGLKVLNDTTGELFKTYQIYSFPQAIYIAPDQSIIGKLPGALESIDDLIKINEKAIAQYNNKNDN